MREQSVIDVVLHHLADRGKGTAIRIGIARATGDAMWHVERFSLVVPDGQPTDAAAELAKVTPERSGVAEPVAARKA